MCDVCREEYVEGEPVLWHHAAGMEPAPILVRVITEMPDSHYVVEWWDDREEPPLKDPVMRVLIEWTRAERANVAWLPPAGTMFTVSGGLLIRPNGIWADSVGTT